MTITAAKPRAKKRPAERWQCPECGTRNAMNAPACSDCGVPNGELQFRAQAGPLTAGEQLDPDEPAHDAPPASGGVELDIPVGEIAPSPHNPREDFDAEALQQLANSMKRHGQLQNAVVYERFDGKGFELIAGERRWRAAKLAGLKTVRCRVLTVSAADVIKVAVELAGIENYERQQFNPVEEANWFRRMIEQAGYTQTSLAARLKITQGQVANRLRLLELPDVWRKRIISQEIPATHARAIVPWTGYPAAMKEIEESFKHMKRDGMWSAEKWNTQVQRDVRDAGRPLTGEAYFKRPGAPYATYHRVAFKPTEDELKQLQVVEVGKQKWCMNVGLWEELQKAGEKKAAERKAKAQTKAEKDATKKTLTPTEKREKARKLAEQQNKRLYRYQLRWLQGELARKIEAGEVGDVLLLRWLLFFACEGAGVGAREDDLVEVLPKGGKGAKHLVSAIAAAGAYMPLVRSAMGRWVVKSFDGYHPTIRPETIHALAEDAQIDFEKQWRPETAFLELCSRDQLLKLADEWGIMDVGLPPLKRPNLIVRLLELAVTWDRRAPKALTSVKPCNVW